MIQEVFTFPSLNLRQLAHPIRNISAQKLTQIIEDMTDTMYAYRGVGLAAPQIGIELRLIIADINENLIVLANPKFNILGDRTPTFKSLEGCLSVPAEPKEINRHEHIEVLGKIPKIEDNKVYWVSFKEQFEGSHAAIFQHEIDHLDGILFLDHIKSAFSKKMYIKKIKNNIQEGQAWRYKVAT